MRKLLLPLLAALLGLLLPACGVFPDAGAASPVMQVQQGAVSTDEFGLRLNLGAGWVRSETSSQGKLVLLYNPEGKPCGTDDCSRLTFSLPSTEYYKGNVQSDFTTIVLCRAAGNKYITAERQPNDFRVGGRSAEYYINDPCVEVAGVIQPRRFTLLFPDKLLIVFEEMPRGAYLGDTGLEQALANATWLQG